MKLVSYDWDPKSQRATLVREDRAGRQVVEERAAPLMPTMTVDQAREGYYAGLKFWLETQA